LFQPNLQRNSLNVKFSDNLVGGGDAKLPSKSLGGLRDIEEQLGDPIFGGETTIASNKKSLDHMVRFEADLSEDKVFNFVELYYGYLDENNLAPVRKIL
jgi:hypothetical protein